MPPGSPEGREAWRSFRKNLRGGAAPSRVAAGRRLNQTGAGNARAMDTNPAAQLFRMMPALPPAAQRSAEETKEGLAGGRAHIPAHAPVRGGGWGGIAGRMCEPWIGRWALGVPPSIHTRYDGPFGGGLQSEHWVDTLWQVLRLPLHARDPETHRVLHHVRRLASGGGGTDRLDHPQRKRLHLSQVEGGLKLCRQRALLRRGELPGELLAGSARGLPKEGWPLREKGRVCGVSFAGQAHGHKLGVAGGLQLSVFATAFLGRLLPTLAPVLILLLLPLRFPDSSCAPTLPRHAATLRGSVRDGPRSSSRVAVAGAGPSAGE